MKIGIIHGSSVKNRNRILLDCAQRAVSGSSHSVVNFGVFEWEEEEYTYVQAAFLASLLLESTAVDFILTGCSSGQGMMLALNSFPGVLCGYTPTPADAFLFGRINGGNAVSLPLALNFGWSGEVNLQYTLNALFEAPFGTGYPPEDGQRKQKDNDLMKAINHSGKVPMAKVLETLDRDFVVSCRKRELVCSYILNYGRNPDINKFLADRY